MLTGSFTSSRSTKDDQRRGRCLHSAYRRPHRRLFLAVEGWPALVVEAPLPPAGFGRRRQASVPARRASERGAFSTPERSNSATVPGPPTGGRAAELAYGGAMAAACSMSVSERTTHR